VSAFPPNSPPGLFLTGTDTDVGKTYVGALIARAIAAQGTTRRRVQTGRERLPVSR
jgi:dethiobiotin synthetase